MVFQIVDICTSGSASAMTALADKRGEELTGFTEQAFVGAVQDDLTEYVTSELGADYDKAALLAAVDLARRDGRQLYERAVAAKLLQNEVRTQRMLSRRENGAVYIAMYVVLYGMFWMALDRYFDAMHAYASGCSGALAPSDERRSFVQLVLLAARVCLPPVVLLCFVLVQLMPTKNVAIALRSSDAGAAMRAQGMRSPLVVFVATMAFMVVAAAAVLLATLADVTTMPPERQCGRMHLGVCALCAACVATPASVWCVRLVSYYNAQNDSMLARRGVLDSDSDISDDE